MGAVRVLVIGDVILDRDLHGAVHRVAPDAPVPVVELERTDERPGGAGLAARLLARTIVAGAGAQHTSVEVTLACGRAEDADGGRLAELLAADGVRQVALTALPTTRSVTRVRSGGQSLLRLDRPAAPLPADAPLDEAVLERELERADAVLVADYGAGTTAHPGVRRALARWASRRPVVWDPHPRGADPVPGVSVATPNRTEALAAAALPAGAALDDAAVRLRDRWQVRAVAATDGATGVITALAASPPLFTPTPYATTGDTCGAGDRFAGTVAVSLACGAVITEAVAAAVEDVAAWLDAGGVAGPVDLLAVAHAGAVSAAADGPAVAGDLLAGVRARGGTVVATGGCFDVLHAGHVACLEAARKLGDHLVVLLNSDDSVRRLKGPQRPVNPAADRARVLAGLACVDEVRVFEDDTPAAALADLRPDVWAKGADYSGDTLPEADLVRSWGGRVVLLPYLPGRSSTRILHHAIETTQTTQGIVDHTSRQESA